MTLATKPNQSVLMALVSEQDLPMHWLHGDDLCDCMVQRIGEWTNSYTGMTEQYRWCCVWDELMRQVPALRAFRQVVPASYDEHRDEWKPDVEEWDSEIADMPLYLWYRQYARKHGLTVGEARKALQGRESERPRKVPVGTGRKAEPSPVDVAVGHLKRLHQTGWNTADFAERLLLGAK